MSTKKSKSDEKPSPELQALYKEYWATKTKFGQQIMNLAPQILCGEQHLM